MDLDWLSMSGDCLINTARTTAYARHFGIDVDCEPCPTIAEAVDDGPYTTPADDKAPWFDVSQPHSARFLGLIPLEVTGLSGSTYNRTLTQRIGDGAFLGPARRRHREIHIRALAIGVDECGLSYGLSWLAAALADAPCPQTNGDGCGGSVMQFFACCPDPNPVLGDVGDLEVRQLFDVGLLDGPREVAGTRQELIGGGWCDDDLDVEYGPAMIAEVEFTLAAGNPFAFYPGIAAGGAQWVDLHTGKRQTTDPDAIYDECEKAQQPPCQPDPTCPLPERPPQPPKPRDACYPRGEYDAIRVLVQMREETVPEWLESVPVVTIIAGQTPLRRVMVRFYPNYLEQDCATSRLDPCSACADLHVSYIPGGATVILDGRTKRATMNCAGQWARPKVFGPRGAGFTWPTFSCGYGWCVEIWAQADTVDAEDRIGVEIVPRSEAI